MKNEHGTGMVVEAAEFIPQLISSIVIFVFGLVFLLINTASAIRYLNYVETEAKIVDVKYNKEVEKYYPVYEYDFNGEMVRVDGISWGNKEDFVIGDRRTINYNPKNYEQFDETSRKDNYISWILCIVALFISGSFLYRVIKMIKGLKHLNYSVRTMLENSNEIEDTVDEEKQ